MDPNSALADLMNMVAAVAATPAGAPAPAPAAAVPTSAPAYYPPTHGAPPPSTHYGGSSMPPRSRPPDSRHVEFDFPSNTLSSPEWATRVVRELEAKKYLPLGKIVPDQLGLLHDADPSVAEDIVRSFLHRMQGTTRDPIRSPAPFFATSIRSKLQEIGGGNTAHRPTNQTSQIKPPTTIEQTSEVVIRADSTRTPNSVMRDHSLPPSRPATWPAFLSAPVLAPGHCVSTTYTGTAAGGGALVHDPLAPMVSVGEEGVDGKDYGAGLFAGPAGPAALRGIGKLFGLPEGSEDAQVIPICVMAAALRSAQLRAAAVGAPLAAPLGADSAAAFPPLDDPARSAARDAVANEIPTAVASWPQRDADAQGAVAILAYGAATASPPVLPPPAAVDLVLRGRAALAAAAAGQVGTVPPPAAFSAPAPPHAAVAVAAANAFDAAAAWGVRFSTVLVVTDVAYEAASLARTLSIIGAMSGHNVVHVSEARATQPPPTPVPIESILRAHGRYNAQYVPPTATADPAAAAAALRTVPLIVVGDAESLQAHSLTREGMTAFGPQAVATVIVRVGVHSSVYQTPTEQPCPSGTEEARKRREGDEGAVSYGALFSLFRRCVPFGAPRAFFLRYDLSPLAFLRFAPILAGAVDANAPHLLVTRRARSSLIFAPLPRRPLRAVFNIDTTIAAPPAWGSYRAMWSQRRTIHRLIKDDTALVKARELAVDQMVDRTVGVRGSLPETYVVRVTPSTIAEVPPDAPMDDRWSDEYCGVITDDIAASSQFRSLTLMAAVERPPLNTRLSLNDSHALPRGAAISAEDRARSESRIDPHAVHPVVHIYRLPPSLVDAETPALTIIAASGRAADVLSVTPLPPAPHKPLHALIRFRTSAAAAAAAATLRGALGCEAQMIAIRADANPSSQGVMPPRHFRPRLPAREAALLAAKAQAAAR